MKVRGNGQAKVLTSSELALLFSEGLTTPRDRALFGVCLFTRKMGKSLALVGRLPDQLNVLSAIFCDKLGE
jgi:integrase/recombinase XerD